MIVACAAHVNAVTPYIAQYVVPLVTRELTFLFASESLRRASCRRSRTTVISASSRFNLSRPRRADDADGLGFGIKDDLRLTTLEPADHVRHFFRQ
jgi:hypothetical protein